MWQNCRFFLSFVNCEIPKGLLNWSRWVRQVHRWLSIAFTLRVSKGAEAYTVPIPSAFEKTPEPAGERVEYRSIATSMTIGPPSRIYA